MTARELRATQLVAADNIYVGAGYYTVGSQYRAGRHRVVVDGLFPSCTCPDFETTGRDCKHLLAVREWLAVKAGERPAPDPTIQAQPVPRKTYGQNWAAYNLAATTEKRWFLPLLADLCRPIPQPERKPTRGTRPVCMADAIFAACFKVYSGYSARRFTTDLEDAAEAGHVGKPIHFNSVLKVLDTPAATPILSDLIIRSAAPLRSIETEFAVDSSGFSGCRFEKWFDQKYGVPRSVGAWVKAHIICGTRTNVIAAAEVLDKDSSDSPQLPGLVATAAKSFTLSEVAADKAYAGNANFEAVVKAGGTLYAAFRSNTTGAVGGLFGKAYHYFNLHREEFLTHYHRRSMIESTFSMVKRVLGDSVKAKTELAMRNEVLAKFVCHNIRCVVSAIYELGINPGCIGLPGDDDGPRSVIRFPDLHTIRPPRT